MKKETKDINSVVKNACVGLPTFQTFPPAKNTWEPERVYTPFAEKDAELANLLERTAPCYAIITYFPETGEYAGVTEESFCMNIAEWRCNIFWTSPHTGDGKLWAKSNILKSIEKACLLLTVSDPNCPIEIDWVTRHNSQTKYGSRNARFRVKEGQAHHRELVELRQRARVQHLTKAINSLECTFKDIVSSLRKEIDSRQTVFSSVMTGMKHQYVKIVSELIPANAYPVDNYGERIQPHFSMSEDGICVYWPTVKDWPELVYTWADIANEQSRRKEECLHAKESGSQE